MTARGGWVLAAMLVAPSLAAAAAPAGDRDDVLAEARRLRQAMDADGAVELLEEALAGGVRDDELAGLLGLCLLDTGAVGRAQELAAGWSSYDGDSHQMHVFLGRLALSQGEPRRAEAAFEAALEIKPAAIEAYTGLVQLYVKGRRLGKALNFAERLEAIRPEVGSHVAAEVLKEQGDRYRANTETLDLAIAKYWQAHEKWPDNRGITDLLIESLVLRVRLDEAHRVIDTVYGNGRDPAAYHYWYGLSHWTAQDPQAAEAAYRRALEHDPEHGMAALRLARVLVSRGAGDEALEWIEASQAVLPESSISEVLMGEILVELDDLEGAEEHLRRAVDLNPSNPQALYHLGRVLVRSGQREEGAEVLARFREVQKEATLGAEALAAEEESEGRDDG